MLHRFTTGWEYAASVLLPGSVRSEAALGSGSWSPIVSVLFVVRVYVTSTCLQTVCVVLLLRSSLTPVLQ